MRPPLRTRRGGTFIGFLRATDGAGSKATAKEWRFQVLPADSLNPEHGPNNRNCSNGKTVDAVELDRRFTCDCAGTRFSGANCEVTVAAAVEDGDSGASPLAIGAVAAVLVALAVAVVLLMKWQHYTRSMLATDFLAQLDAMKERGEVDDGQVLNGGVPRELKRGWLALIDKLGHGQFGDVWKGLFKDGNNLGVPEYMVACKVVKDASGSLDAAGFAAAEEELLKEALLMAQVENHQHLVSLVGVRGLYHCAFWYCTIGRKLRPCVPVR